MLDSRCTALLFGPTSVATAAVATWSHAQHHEQTKSVQHSTGTQQDTNQQNKSTENLTTRSRALPRLVIPTQSTETLLTATGDSKAAHHGLLGMQQGFKQRQKHHCHQQIFQQIFIVWKNVLIILLKNVSFTATIKRFFDRLINRFFDTLKSVDT